MPIKQISLRGISRAPSDRMTNDGGCAESLNVHLDENELSPTLPPEDITEREGLPGAEYGLKYDILYYHKTNNYANYICKYGNQVGVWEKSDSEFFIPKALKDAKWITNYKLVTDGVGEPDEDGVYTFRVSTTEQADYIVGDGDGNYYKIIGYNGGNEVSTELRCTYVGMLNPLLRFNAFLTLNDSEIISDVTNIGNTIVICSSSQMSYALYKDGYSLIGNEIPMPSISFKLDKTIVDESMRQVRYSTNVLSGLQYAERAFQFTNDIWFTSKKHIKGEALYDAYYLTKQIIEDVKDKADVLAEFYGRYCRPIFVRYSIYLYDGSEIISEPVFINSSTGMRRLSIEGQSIWKKTDDDILGEFMSATITFSYPNLYNLYLQDVDIDTIKEMQDTWSDIAKSIRIYISTDICPDEHNTLSGAVIANRTVDNRDESAYNEVSCTIDLEKMYASEEELLSKSNFYLVREYPISSLLGIQNSTSSEDKKVPYYNNTDRVLKEELSSNMLNPLNTYHCRKLMSFNNRIIEYGMRILHKDGIDIPAMKWGISGFIHKDWSIHPYYFIKSESGRDVVLSGQDWNDERQFCLLLYPTSKCYKVLLKYATESETMFFEVDMLEHPSMDYAYFYNTDYSELHLLLDAVYSGTSVAYVRYLEGYIIPEINTVENIENKLYITRESNFYVFSTILTFSGRIRGVATTTKALSTGQFGQFPLYVFTEDGIWTLTTEDDGSFGSSAPLSREVALDGKVFPIDQAIVFITEKGVMMLQGSDIMELSPNMNGKHWVIEDDAKDVISSKTQYGNLLEPLVDNTPFMAFMKQATCCYDYTGKRLVFFNGSCDYQYVYMLPTGTWHKCRQNAALPYHLDSAINSYPDCLISGTDTSTDTTVLLNLSTPLDVERTDEIQSVIATRPMDLDNPDILKTVNHLKIRGQYQRYDEDGKPRVSYMIFGSQDGIHFHRLKSLRGKSWKLFRVIVLSSLTPTERLSWIDIDYETRFTNKLR